MMKKKLKILIVSDYFYPHWTGISKSIYNLTLSLKNEIEFTVLTVRYKNDLKREENINGIKIVREDYLFTLSRLKYSLTLIWRFIFLINNTNIVFLNSPLSNILPLSIITKIFGKKLFIFHQGDLILRTNLINWLIERIFDFSTLISFTLANKVSTYNKDYANNSRLLKYFLNKFTPLLMPIILPLTDSVKNASLLKLSKLKKNKKVLFGFAGRFVEEKGFDILFDAIPQVIKKLSNAHFVFAGETQMDYENFFQENFQRFKKIEKNVTLLGLLNEQEMIHFYKSIDFIIVPSRSDCYNLVQAEAMSFKKPAVVSDIPGLRFLVKKTNFGLTFEKNNPNDLTDKILFITKNKKRYIKNYQKVIDILITKRNNNVIKKIC